MSNVNFHLFVYGSLRSGFHSPAYEYMSRYFDFVGDAKVKGRLYDMVEYAAAAPSTEDYFIIGELYWIKNEKEFDWAIGQLDDYEGISPEPGEMQLFRRELVEVYINGGKTNSWIYWYNGDISDRPLIESGDMMQYFREKNRWAVSNSFSESIFGYIAS